MKISAFATAVAPMIESLRLAYLAEIGHFADSLRHRFEAGELRGNTSADYEDEPGSRPPLYVLEDLCRRHFGLVVKRKALKNGDTEYVSDSVTAYLVMLVSPAARVLSEENWNHIADGATEMIAADVVAIARARGWYDPTAETHPPAAATRWARASVVA